MFGEGRRSLEFARQRDGGRAVKNDKVVSRPLNGRLGKVCSCILTALLITGCGSSLSGPSATVQALARGSFTLRDPATSFAQSGTFPDILAITFSLGGSGLLSASVTRTSVDNNVGFVVLQGTCGAQTIASCGSRVAGPVESRTTTAAYENPAFTPGPYTWLIYNLGPGAESGTYEMTLKKQ